MNKKSESPILRYVLIAVLLSFPVVLLILPTWRRSSVAILLLCAFVCLVCRVKPDGKTLLFVLKKYWQINLSMAGMVIAILLHQLGHDEFALRSYEKAMQLAALPLFVWTLLLLSTKDLRVLQWSLIIGVALSSMALHWITQGGSIRDVGVMSSPLIPFSNLSVLMGFMALLSIGWDERTEKGLITLKISAWSACLYASYVSGTRGSWIVIPFFIVIAISLVRGVRNSHKILISLSATILIAVVMASLPYTKARMELAHSDVVSYFERTNADTSVGIRLQLWDIAWNIFRSNPISGVGVAGYEKAVKRLAEEGMITPQAGLQIHAHNDVLHALATLGGVGALATLAIYFVPGLWFAKQAKNPDRKQRVTAGMGLAVCVGYFVFGMTDTMFYWSFCNGFFVIVLATLFALIIKRQEELEKMEGERFTNVEALPIVEIGRRRDEFMNVTPKTRVY